MKLNEILDYEIQRGGKIGVACMLPNRFRDCFASKCKENINNFNHILAMFDNGDGDVVGRWDNAKISALFGEKSDNISVKTYDDILSDEQIDAVVEIFRMDDNVSIVYWLSKDSNDDEFALTHKRDVLHDFVALNWLRT